MESSSIAARLWQENAQLAEQALQHPFVQQMGNQTLPKEYFDAYIHQDVFYLACFKEGYEVAVEKASDQPEDVQQTLRELRDGTAEELEAVHGRFQMDGQIPADFKPHAATLKYTAFLKRVTDKLGLASILAAMTPCNRLYAFLGQRLKQVFPRENHNYSDWIDFYAGQEFEASAKKIEAVLDRLAPSTEYDHLASLYREAMQLEIDFFEANTPH